MLQKKSHKSETYLVCQDNPTQHAIATFDVLKFSCMLMELNLSINPTQSTQINAQNDSQRKSGGPFGKVFTFVAQLGKAKKRKTM